VRVSDNSHSIGSGRGSESESDSRTVQGNAVRCVGAGISWDIGRLVKLVCRRDVGARAFAWRRGWGALAESSLVQGPPF